MSRNTDNIKYLCKFYMDGYCEKGKDCLYIHDDKACKYHFFEGNCTDKNCSYGHNYPTY